MTAAAIAFSRTKQIVSALAVGALLLLASGCIPRSGTYPIDVFPELHYSPGYRSQEPPRLAPPEGAVPITGSGSNVQLGQARDLPNPISGTPENLQRAAELYRINCRACHGTSGRGDGFVAPYFERANIPRPVDFTSGFIHALSDGQLFAIIGNGLDGMPAFRNLLNDGERWLLVLQIRSFAGQGSQ